MGDSGAVWGGCQEGSAKVLVLKYVLPRPDIERAGWAIKDGTVQFRLPAWRYGRPADRSVSPNDVIWGVRRKMGYDVVDDPWRHRGITQHAYYVGHDTIALCGYRPFRWRRSIRVPLAAATELNPACPSCLAAVAFVPIAVPRTPISVAVPVAALKPTDKSGQTSPTKARKRQRGLSDKAKLVRLTAPTYAPILGADAHDGGSRFRQRQTLGRSEC